MSGYGFSPYLMGALFFGVSSHSWSSEDDSRWRATTQAPYFENKVPESESLLPAAAVVGKFVQMNAFTEVILSGLLEGAATAFGLSTLLPLNVPASMPLLYCNGIEVAQQPIKIGSEIFACGNMTVEILCSKVSEFSDQCSSETMECDVEGDSPLYCSNSTLMANSSMFCNSTTEHKTGETMKVLNCYEGELPELMTSFIPTTTVEPERDLSIGAIVHVLMMYAMGRSDEMNAVTSTTQDPPTEAEKPWVPEALVIPPETIASRLNNFGLFVDSLQPESDGDDLSQKLTQD